MNKRTPTGRGFLVSTALCATFAVGCQPTGPLVELQSDKGKKIPVSVEIVSTPELLRKGLMWRSELPDDHGMLFVFEGDAPRSFWMKNTPLPLDILFINSDGKIVSIARNTVPYSLASIPSAAPANYVLEVNAGFSSKHGIVAVSQVTLPVLETAPAPSG